MLYTWKKNARTFTSGLDSEFSVLSSEDAFIVLGGNDALLNLKLEEAGIRKNFRQFAHDRRHDLLDRRLGHHQADLRRLPRPRPEVHRHDDRRRRCRPSSPSSSASAS